MVDTRSSTEQSDIFLDDLFMQLTKELNIPPYAAIIREKKYLSQLWISTDKSFDVINPRPEEIAAYLSDHAIEGGPPFNFGGLSFWPDQTEKYPQPAFTIERAAGVHFSENRYFSAAPLQTEQHLELLDKLESILS